MDMKEIRHEGGVEKALRPFRPSRTLTIFVYLPIWLGLAWTVLSVFMQLGIPIALLFGFLLTTVLFGATNYISGYLLEAGTISQHYARFGLYRSWWERNVRGYLMITPVSSRDSQTNSEAEMSIFVSPRARKFLGFSTRHSLWVSLGGWLPRRGGIQYSGFSRNAPSLSFKFDSLDEHGLRVLLIQSNGGRLSLPLREACLMAEADAESISSGMPRWPETMEGVVERFFRELQRNAASQEVTSE